ncbi:hypothetical protein EGM88_12160 [Aureibaculum marinum]|uniref:Lipoprotein n=1 Tax=Aureibaculum marinum TaxID=2487930 RepID=A0A3N4NSD6_9FLAO|nr:hypothetical protein [Aureibaculum marinum]RPD94489.1 hypothetical protein EGM88_12160 [Aureibaculum marinum]
MRTFSSLFIILICLISCNTNEAVSDNTPKTNIIQKEKAHLSHAKYTNAIRFYGEPISSHKIKVTEKNLSKEQLTIVNKYFPNKEYEYKKVYFLEAQWKRPSNLELTVWYLFIENEWKPIEVRANT